MADSVIHTSFAAGELSENLFARVDLDKFQVGAALLRNFYVDFRGGATIRPGSQFVARANTGVPGPKQLIPFIVSETTAYMLEFGEQYIRYFFDGAAVVEDPTTITGITQANPAVVTDVAHGYTSGDEVFISDILGMTPLNGRTFLISVLDADHYSLGGINSSGYPAYISGGTASRVLTTVTPYLAEDLALLKFTQSADVLTLTHQSYAPANLTRLTANSFSLAPVVIGPKIAPPSALSGSATDAGSYRYGYCVTAVSLDGKEESLPSNFTVVESEAQDEADHKTIGLLWTESPDPVSVYRIYKWGPVDSGRPPQSVFGFCGQSKAPNFEDLNFAPDFTKTPPEFSNPFVGGQITSVTVLTTGAGYTDWYDDLVITGDGTGAEGFVTIQSADGTVRGAFITNPGKGYTSASATAGAGGATFSFTFSPIADPNPACATYFQQRRVFGEPLGQPETLALSQIGNYDNFDKGLIVLDSDAFTMGIASRQVNRIKSLVPMSGGMIAFTSGGAFLISGQSAASAITPNTAVALPQASSGANDVPPVVVNYDVLFVTGGGNTVRDLQFNFGVQSYYGFDRSTLANHLFQDYTLLDLAWAEEPQKLLWALRSDGKLLSLAYVPEEEVYGWSRHDTYGIVQSIAAIPEGSINVVYLVVNRPINGVWTQFIERFTRGNPSRVEDSWQVDSGLAYPLEQPNATLIFSAATGLSVSVVADAAVFAPSNVNDIIWAGGGQASIISYTSPTQVQVEILQTLTATLDDGIVVPIDPGWEMGTPVLNVTGLDHLAGQTNISVLADGLALLNQSVNASGELVEDLPWPATKIVVGLPYKAQLQTLNLEIQGIPTLQGQFKTIVAVTARLLKARGLSCGQEFSRMVPMKDLKVFGPTPSPLVTDDIRIILPNAWTVEGRMCFQQDYPLPATILGLIPEVTRGDTGR